MVVITNKSSFNEGDRWIFLKVKDLIYLETQVFGKRTGIGNNVNTDNDDDERYKSVTTPVVSQDSLLLNHPPIWMTEQEIPRH